KYNIDQAMTLTKDLILEAKDTDNTDEENLKQYFDYANKILSYTKRSLEQTNTASDKPIIEQYYNSFFSWTYDHSNIWCEGFDSCFTVNTIGPGEYTFKLNEYTKGSSFDLKIIEDTGNIITRSFSNIDESFEWKESLISDRSIKIGIVDTNKVNLAKEDNWR